MGGGEAFESIWELRTVMTEVLVAVEGSGQCEVEEWVLSVGVTVKVGERWWTLGLAQGSANLL